LFGKIENLKKEKEKEKKRKRKSFKHTLIVPDTLIPFKTVALTIIGSEE